MRFVKKALSLLLATAMLCTTMLPALAAGFDMVDPTQKGSLTVKLKANLTSYVKDAKGNYKMENGKYVTVTHKDIPATGAELALYKVGNVGYLGSSRDSYQFRTEATAFADKATGFGPAYDELGMNINNPDSAVDALALVKWMAAHPDSNIEPVDQALVGTDGLAKFEDLELGLYLVMQYKAANGYPADALCSPFLITVPMRSSDGSNVYNVTDVLAAPKLGNIEVGPGPEPENGPTPTPTPTNPLVPLLPLIPLIPILPGIIGPVVIPPTGGGDIPLPGPDFPLGTPLPDGPGLDFPDDAPGFDFPDDNPGFNFPDDNPGFNFPDDNPGFNFPTDGPGFDIPSDAPGLDWPLDGPGFDPVIDAPPVQSPPNMGINFPPEWQELIARYPNPEDDFWLNVLGERHYRNWDEAFAEHPPEDDFWLDVLGARHKRLSSTGQLWWPVPVMAAGGLLMFAAGWRRRRDEEEE